VSTPQTTPARPPLGGDSSARIAALIDDRLRDVPDFPERGVLFKDIAPLLADGPAWHDTMAELGRLARSAGRVDLVAGVEARGFLVAAALAGELACGLLPVRKAGKLPPPTIRREYALEYGTAVIEMPSGPLAGRRVYLVDDVLATGGTLRAAAELIEQAGGEIAGIGVLLELSFLGGRAALGGYRPQALLTL